MICAIEVGDRSKDGHNICETVHADIIGATGTDIMAALEELKTITGWSFHSNGCRSKKNIACEFGDNTMPLQAIADFKEAGVDFGDIFPETFFTCEVDSGRTYIDGAHEFVRIVLSCAKARIPNMQFEIVCDPTAYLDLGYMGYGLFEY